MGSKKKKPEAENTTQFSIDDGIPVPPRTNGQGRPSKYPFAALKPGQSFFVPTEPGKGEAIRSSASRYNRRNPDDGKLISRIEEGGVRVWKVAAE